MSKVKKRILKPVIEEQGYPTEQINGVYKSTFTKVHQQMKKMKFDCDNSGFKSQKLLKDLISQVFWLKSGRSLESWYSR